MGGRASDGLHAVARENPLAASAEPGPVLLQTLLNGKIIVQLMAAKALRVSAAGSLFFRRAHVTLRKSGRSGRHETKQTKGYTSHDDLRGCDTRTPR